MAQEHLTPDPTAIVLASLGPGAASLFNKLLRQPPKPADAIIFLQGDQLDRAPAVVSLYKKGFAPTILITGNNDLIGRGKRNEENDVHLSQLKTYLVKHGITEGAVMVDDKSLNTLQQAVTTVGV